MKLATSTMTTNETMMMSSTKQQGPNNMKQKEIRSKDYYPSYASSMTEAPMFDIVASNLFGTSAADGSSSSSSDNYCRNNWLNYMISFLYQIRWMMSYPLRTRIVPHSIPYPNNIHPTITTTILSGIIHITIGEILLCAPIVFCCIEGLYISFGMTAESSSTISTSIPHSGTMATYVLFLTYTSANKSNSLFAFIFGIPFERMIYFHKICSIASIILSCFHIYTAHSQRGFTTSIISYLIQDRTNITGTVATVCMILLVTTSIYSKLLRHYAFQIWLSSHIIFAVLVLIALFLHGVTTGVFVALWWSLDIIVRYGIMTMCQYRIAPNDVQLRRIAHSTTTTTTSDCTDTHDAAIEISFPKPIGFNYNAGQFVQIAIPAISIFEFHPVSLSSAPHEEYVTMHLRQRGDWTRKLVQLSETKSSTSIWMEGPYGSLSVDIRDTHRYQMVLLICGGIGVTPCQSIGKTILHAHTHQQRPLKYMQMVWAVRDMTIVNDIPPLGGINSDNAIVQVDIYCTQTAKNTTFANEGDIEMTTNTIPEQPLNQELSNNNYNTIYGQRPNINEIFRTMRQKANEMGETNIAVVGCGPTALMDDIQTACRTYSQPSIHISCQNNKNKKNDGVYFDLHTEHFEY